MSSDSVSVDFLPKVFVTVFVTVVVTVCELFLLDTTLAFDK